MGLKEQLELVNDQTLDIVMKAGQTVDHGETPTQEQVYMAAIHAREDAARANLMAVLIAAEQVKIKRWLYFIVFLLLCVLANF